MTNLICKSFCKTNMAVTIYNSKRRFTSNLIFIVNFVHFYSYLHNFNIELKISNSYKMK